VIKVTLSQTNCYRALYNLGSGSWLALTVVPWRKLVAAHSPR